MVELTPAFISSFELYLATVPKLAHNSIWTYMPPLKKMTDIAVKNRWLTYDPFADYAVSYQETDVGYLDKEDIKALMEVKLTKRLEPARICFCFASLPDSLSAICET